MNRIRLLPVVVLAIAALLVLKTLGLVANGSYVLTGMGTAQAAGGGAAAPSGEGDADWANTPLAEPTLEDASPTLVDPAPTMGGQAEEAGGHGAAPAEGEPAADHGAAPAGEPSGADHGAAPAAEGEDHGEATAQGEQAHAEQPNVACFEADATLTESGEIILEGDAAEGGGHGESPAEAAGDHGESPAEAEPADAPEPANSFAASMIDCLPSGDAVPREITGNGTAPLSGGDGTTPTEGQLLERLAARRAELQQYEQDLTLRASIVDAAEKRIAERTTTLEALEAQIASLVDQRTEMESGQFAGIVAMYESMKPKDAATIFNNLDMDVLLRVAKTMSPRKMAPILAEMDSARAQELTVKMADLADKPAAEMTPDDLAALPQIVGQ